jgi:hypothetical protein
MRIMENKGNNRIDEVLSSFDGTKRATAPDFFYTRLKAKMLARQEEGEKGLASNNRREWMLKPVYIVTAILLVLAINVLVFLKGRDENTTADTITNNESVQQSIAAEYSLNDMNTVYDLNADK